MDTITLHRKPLPNCSIGFMAIDNHIVHTLERPLILSNKWRGGKPFESCVPFGNYLLEPHSSDKHGHVYALVNEDLGVYHYKGDRLYETDRYAILIHVANWVREIVGCIAVGRNSIYEPDMGTYRLGSSRDGMNDLRKHINFHKPTNIEIVRL